LTHNESDSPEQAKLGQVGTNLSGADAHVERGLDYLNRGRVHEAAREFEAAIEIAPNHAEAHLNLGCAYLNQGDVDGANREYKEAIRLYPPYAAREYRYTKWPMEERYKWYWELKDPDIR